MNKKYVIIGAIVVIILIIVGVKFAGNSDEPEMTIPHESSAPVEVAGWKTISNKEFGYEITVPVDFTVASTSETDLRITFPKSYSEKTNLSVADISLAVTEEDPTACKGKAKINGVNVEPKSATINGQKYYIVEQAETAGGVQYDTITYSTIAPLCTKITLRTGAINFNVMRAVAKPGEVVSEFDKTKILGVFGEILKKFKVLDLPEGEMQG